MKRFIALLIWGAAMIISTSLAAQVDTVGTWRVTTIDGNEYIGKILKVTEDSIRMVAWNLGAINLAQRNVKFSEPVMASEDQPGEFWPENHHATRYFFGPNGHALRKGEGYYQNNWVLFNQVSIGINDYITLGAGMVPVFLLGGDAGPVWLTPKVSFPIIEGKLSAGFGALAGTILGESSSGFGILYGVATTGDRDKNATLGVGYGYVDGTLASSPVISISGMVRAGAKGYVITENYWFGSGEGGLISLGGRTAWKNLALDYGGIIPYGFDQVIIIPWLGISVPFGKKNVLEVVPGE